MRTRNLALILLVLSPSIPGHVTAQPCEGTIVGNILRKCDSSEQVRRALPCGVTNALDDDCFADMDGECSFAIGTRLDSDWVLFEWLKDSSTGAVPTEGACTGAMLSVFGCQSQGFLDQCPDPIASDGDDVCPPFCGSDCPAFCEDLGGSIPAWDEECRAYALMPQDADHWTPASGYFLVGRHFPFEALSWDGDGDQPYSAMQGLLENQLGPPMLGIAGVASIWGDAEGKVGTLEQLEEHFCIYRRKAVLASPYWQIEDSSTSSGIAAFPILRTRHGRSCDDGLDLYLGQSADGEPMTDRDWSRSGTHAPRVVEALSLFALRHQHRLVCIDSVVAGERRALRRADPRP